MTVSFQQPSSRFSRRPGFGLVDVLVVMSGVSLVLFVAIVTVLLVLKIDRSGSAGLQALVVQKELADEFRADAAAAASAPDEFGRLKAGKECLLLRRGDGDVIVYRWESGVLERSALSS